MPPTATVVFKQLIYFNSLQILACPQSQCLSTSTFWNLWPCINWPTCLPCYFHHNQWLYPKVHCWELTHILPWLAIQNIINKFFCLKSYAAPAFMGWNCWLATLSFHVHLSNMHVQQLQVSFTHIFREASSPYNKLFRILSSGGWWPWLNYQHQCCWNNIKSLGITCG